MLAPTTNLTLAVAGVDQLGRVSKGEGVETNTDPGSDEGDEKEETRHISTSPFRVGSSIRRIIVRLLLPSTTLPHFDL